MKSKVIGKLKGNILVLYCIMIPVYSNNVILKNSNYNNNYNNNYTYVFIYFPTTLEKHVTSPSYPCDNSSWKLWVKIT